jgi:N-acetylglucosaminyldiphosphoundecaprenol N-acetyl-beta-D-mannosaminyltransferase
MESFNPNSQLTPPFNRAAYQLLNIVLWPVDEAELLAFIHRSIVGGKQVLMPALNIHGTHLACQMPWLKDYFNQAELVYCDSDGVRLGLRLLGYKPPVKITVSRWIWRLCEFCEASQHTLFFLGGRPGAPEESARRLCERYPRLKVVGVADNNFEQQDHGNETLVSKINHLKPDIIVVGLGQPRQEKWILANRSKLNVRVIIPAGATFEFVSGRLRIVPDLFYRLQLEWFYRLLQEPKRNFKRYVIENPVFFYRILRERFHRMRKS